MPIPSDSPLIVPATPEKTFPHLWLYALNTLAPSEDSGRIAMEILPYNAETHEIATAPKEFLSTDKLWQAVAEVPEVKAVFDAVILAVPAFQAWLAAQQPAAPEPEPQPEP